MKNKQRKSHVWDIVDVLLLEIQLLISVGFAFLVKTMLPMKYWVILVIVFVLLFLVMAFVMTLLTRMVKKEQKGKKRKIFVWILSIILSVGLGIGYSAIAKGLDTLDEITQGGNYQTHYISIIVKNDSGYQSVSDLNGKNMGILQGMDDENTEKALQKLSEMKEVSLHTVEYTSIIEIVNALLNGDVEAILYNDAYIAIMDEVNADFASSIKTLQTFEILEKIEDEFVNSSDEVVSGDDIFTQEGSSEEIFTTENSNEETSNQETFNEENSREENSNEESSNQQSSTQQTSTQATQPSQTQPLQTQAPVQQQKPSDVTKESFTIYISGMDKYGAVSSVSRTDVNMLVTINPRTRQILMTSIPRDYYVRLATKNGNDKLTHTGLFGVTESVRTLENLFGVDIDYYMKVNFTSLINMVDSVGGITVNNPRAFDGGGYHFAAGQISLNGAQALAFSRERYAFGSGDHERVKNQQRVLTGLIEKMISPAIITNYSSILSAVSGSFITDMSSAEIQSLIQMQLNDMRGWNIQQISVTGTGSHSTSCYALSGTSLYVMIPDYASVSSAAAQINAVSK